MVNANDTAQFSSFAQWFIRGITRNLARNAPALHGVVLGAPEKATWGAQLALQEFARALCADMALHPESYAIPVETYPDTEQFNKKRLNVARIINGVIFDYLYAMGLKGKVANGCLELEAAVYETIVADKRKKAQLARLHDALARLGLHITRGKVVAISSAVAPGLGPALSDLAKACARFKHQGTYLFRRFDFGVLDPEYRLAMPDVLNGLDAPRRERVFETDRLLRNSRYQCKIEPYQDFGYRLVYSNKAGVVCYVHVNSYFEKPLYAYIRWVLDTEPSRTFFKIVDGEKPGYAQYVFDHICPCDPACIPGFGAQSPESCMARILIDYGDQSAYVCKDARWNVYNQVSEDFEFIATVLRAVTQVLYAR